MASVTIHSQFQIWILPPTAKRKYEVNSCGAYTPRGIINFYCCQTYKYGMLDKETMDQYILVIAMKDADPERVYNSSIKGNTWLQKIMYIASKSHGDNRFGFKPYKYGMYSATLEESVTRCSQDGLICTNHPDGDGPIHITDKGKEKMDPNKCDDNMLLELQSIKSVLNNLDYRQMIVYSCALFPEMAKHSKIVDDFESWRVKESTTMYLKGSVSFALAATISGLGRDGFGNHLRDGGVEPYSPLVRTKVIIPMKRPEF